MLCDRFARKRAQQGNVHIGKMEYFRALSEFEKALEASPNVPDILLGYSQVMPSPQVCDHLLYDA